MRTLVISTLTSTLTFAFVAILFTPAPPEAAAAQEASMPPLVTQEEYERWLTELSNWGRWGPDDELGTLNLITPAKRTEAAALVIPTGSVCHLRRLLKRNGPLPTPPHRVDDGARHTDRRERSGGVSLHTRPRHDTSRCVCPHLLRRQDVERL